MTNAQEAPDVVGEIKWIENYVATRKNWLGNSTNPLLQRTVYRMESFQFLIKSYARDLPLPLQVRGLVIDAGVLEERSLVVASAHDNTQRIRRLATPLMSGEEVEAIQIALKSIGLLAEVDSVFGQKTDAAVRAFQQ